MAGASRTAASGAKSKRAGGTIPIGGEVPPAFAEEQPAAAEASAAAAAGAETAGAEAPGAPAPQEPPRRPSARMAARTSDYRPPYAQSARRPGDQRENAFQGVAWILEGVTGVVEELRHSDLGLTEEFWVHAYAARRESLLALRTLVDQLIEKADAADREEEERRLRLERRGGIKIQDE